MKNRTSLFLQESGKRIVALVLAVCIMLTMSPPIGMVQAAEIDGEHILLSGFAELPHKVREQNVPLGVSSADLVLPDTLEAYLAEPNFGDAEELPPAESEPEELPPAESEPEELPPAESEPEELPPAESEPEELPPAESEPEETPPAASEPEPAPAEPAAQELSAYVESDIAETDDEATTPATIIVEGVTWESEPEFDGDTAGTYIFTAALPSGYTVEDGVAIPEITVEVRPAIKIDYAALVDTNKYFAEHQEELLEQIDELAENTEVQEEHSEEDAEAVALPAQTAAKTASSTDEANKPVGKLRARGIGVSGVEADKPEVMTYVTTQPTLEQMVAPIFSGFDVEKSDGGVQMTAGISETRGQAVAEYGFVWSLDGTEPTVANNAGMSAFSGDAKMEDFTYTLEGREDALVRGYSIYDGMVSYTGALTTDNMVEADGSMLPISYKNENGGMTMVYGQGMPYDIPIIQLPLIPWPMGTGFKVKWGEELGRSIDPEETIYIIIKGSIVGVPILDIDGKHIGNLQSSANEEYYIIAMKGRDLAANQNMINILLPPILPGWMYVDNIQMVFGGGPGALEGKTAKVEDVTFQGYNFSEEFARYDLTVDGVVKATNETEKINRIFTSVTVNGNKMYASQKYKNIGHGFGQQTLTTNNKCADGWLTYIDGTLTLAAAMGAKPPAGSGWAQEDPDEVIVSVLADTIKYDNNVGPHEYRLDFDYIQNYYSTGVKGPLQVKTTVQSVFGLPVSYIMLPGTNRIEENDYKNDKNEGLDYAGELKKAVRSSDIFKDELDPITVPADSAKRVYGYETAFEVETNGAYEFKVAGPGGVLETFVLEVNNIDNQPPTLDVVGAMDMTMLEDTPFVELGYGGNDNRSLEDNLTKNIEVTDGLNLDKPDGGEYELIYSVTDQAGNETSDIRKLHIKNRPLDLVTLSAVKENGSVTMKGNIRYLGDQNITERGFVWDLSSAPTVDANIGKSSAKYNVHNKEVFTATAALSSLIPNATYYCRPYAKTRTGKVVYGASMSFTANEKNYGVFSITPTAGGLMNTVQTLTITRKDGSEGEQTVHWRTVDGSSRADVHYQAASGTVRFAPGETKKTIRLELKSTIPKEEWPPRWPPKWPKKKAEYPGWQISHSMFFVELTSVTGGGVINDAARTCKVSYTKFDDIQRTNMNKWVVVSQDVPQKFKRYGGAGAGRRDYLHYPSEYPGYNLEKYKYWSFQGRVEGKQQLTIRMKDSDSGLDVFVRKENTTWYNVASHWYDWGDGEKICQTGYFDLTGQDYVMGRGLSQVRVAWSWVEFTNPRLSINYNDTTKPSLKSITALSGDYKADDYIYFAARFSEIVSTLNQDFLYMDVALDTGGNVKALYETGAGTDTLVFKLKVPVNSKSAGVTATLKGARFYVEDLAKNKSSDIAGVRLPGVNINSMPYNITYDPTSGTNAHSHSVKITVTKPQGYKGTGAQYKYVFSTSQELDGATINQARPFNSGDTVVLDGGTGRFYLHVLVSDSLGVYRSQTGAYDISNDMPAFTVVASTDKWTKDPVRVFLKMHDLTYFAEGRENLRLYMRDNSDGKIGNAGDFVIAGATPIPTDRQDSGGFYFDTDKNGSWALLAVDEKSGNTYFSTAMVSCIDTVAPTVELAKDQTSVRVTTEKMAGYAYTAPNPAVYAYCADADSGLTQKEQSAVAQYQFSTESTPPANGWKDYKDGDLLTVQEYFGRQQSGSFYLHLRATDMAGNVTTVTHSERFVVPKKTPPTITVEVEPLPAGLNDFGTMEGAYTAAQLTAPDPKPADLTGRSAWMKVTLKKNPQPGAGDLAVLMLPGNQNIYDNNNRPDPGDKQPVSVDGYEVKDLNLADGIIEIRYPAAKNGIYRFMGSDKNSNGTGFNEGRVIITGIDKNAPIIDYGRYDKNGKMLLPGDWVKSEDGVTLKLSFSDLETPLYGESDQLIKYIGSEGLQYLILQGDASETSESYKPYDGTPVTFTTDKNDTFMVKVRDRIGNSYIQRIAVTNIDSTPPYVDTTNTSYGVALAPIKMQLKYADKEMGLCKVRKYLITGDTNAPAVDTLLDYDGRELALRDPGTWYVHYYARDDVGHVTEGYFGPYTVDSGKPAIAIDSRTSDEFAVNEDGSINVTFRDDRYARMHSAQVTVTYPTGTTNPVGEKREYQWSRNPSPSLFNWTVAPTGTVDAANNMIVRFNLDSWGSEGVSGRWYLHVRTKGTASYRGFLFDNDLPVITIIGDNPAYLPRGESYIDRGATAVDAQDNAVAVTTKLVTGKDDNGKDIVVDTKYFPTGVPGQHLVTYTATDGAGNSSTAQRVVFIYDDKPPYVQPFARETDEDTLLAFTEADFTEHFEDDSNKPTMDDKGEITHNNALDKVKIVTLPTQGILRLDGALVAAGDEIPRARLGGLAYNPGENYFGADSFTYGAYDTGIGDRLGNLSANTATVSLTVKSVNDAPSADSLTSEMLEDESVNIDLKTVIKDIEDGTSLTVALGAPTAAPAATSNVTSPGSAAVSGQTVTYTPAKDFNGTVTIPYTVTDAAGAKASSVITVIVANVNDAPVIGGVLLLTEDGTDDKLYRGGQTVTVSWTPASDADNDKLTYRLILTKPDGSTEAAPIAAKLEGTSYVWTVPKLDGRCKVSVIAKDSALDSNTVTGTEFVIDSTKPTVNSIIPNEHGWGHEASVSVTAEVSDAAHDQQNTTLITQYAVDTSGDGKKYTSDTWAASASGTTVSAEGLNKVRVRVTDAAGNVSDVRTSGEYKLDRTIPAAFTAVSSLNPMVGTDAAATTKLTVSGRTVDDTSARPGVSGMRDKAYQYKLDSEVYTAADKDGKHTFDIPLKPDTQHTMTILATDVAENMRTATVTAYTRAQDAQTATLNKWDSGSLEISFTAPANRPETVYEAWLTTRYGTEKIAESIYSTELTRTFTGLAEDTEYVLYIRSKNGDGLVNTPARFDKDSTDAGFKTNKKPVLTLNDNTKRYYKADEIITFTGTVEDTDVDYHDKITSPTIKVLFGGMEKDATLTASASLFGLLTSDTKWSWTVDLTVDTELASVPDGKYEPTVTATDNIAETGSLSFTEGVWLDRLNPNAPTIDVTDAPAQNPLIFSKEKSVAAKLTEQGDTATGTVDNENPSQFKELRYRLDGDPAIAGGGQSTNSKWVAATSDNSIAVTDEGHTTITAQAEDRAGNLMESTKELYIDRTRPTQNTPPAATVVNTSAVYDNSWVSSKINVTLTADDTVGVGKIYAKVTDNNTALGEAEGSYDGTLTKSYSGSALEQQVTTTITLAAQQQNYIHYMYVDTAGNKQTYVAGPYKIDTTAPAPVFAVNAKELTSEDKSVVLRGHGASVGIFDAGNIGANVADLHVAGLTKSEFIWLPARVDDVPTTGDTVTVADDTNTPPRDNGSGPFNWADFTNGATLVQGGEVNGKWHLWVRLTDAAGNIKCYNESEKASRPADQHEGKGYEVFRFDNTAPSLPDKDGSGIPLPPGSVINNKTYGSLDIELPTDDGWFDDSNADGIEYQYTFTTDAEPPPKEGLPVFKFESYSEFLAFPYDTSITISPAVDKDILWSSGVTLAAEFMVMPGDTYKQFHTLLDMGGFKVQISDVTGAIVVTDSNGKTKHLGGAYNDGRIHKLVVSAGFGSAIKVYADGKYLGRFWFPTITKDKLRNYYTMGSWFNGQIYKATLFGRVADDDEGKSFIFRTDDIVGDYVFCAGLENNVSEDKTTITDRSGQKNNATVNANRKWDRDYKSAEFLSEGATDPFINLDQYLPEFRSAKALTISTTFKTTKTTDDTIDHVGFGGRVGNTLFGATYMGFDTLYISPYKSTNGTDSGVAVFFSTQTTPISSGGTDWTKFVIADIRNTDVSDGKTHTVTVTIKGDKAQIYVDSLLKTTVTLQNRWLTDARTKVTHLRAGGYNDVHNFEGTLYNTKLFARALTQEEIESGNINYLDSPIAILNYTHEQSGNYGGNWDSVVQTGEGMRFDDSGDYIDLGRTVDIIGDTADNTINAIGFSTSVRFNADRARWTGSYHSGDSTKWGNPDVYEGQRLFTMLLDKEVGNTDVANMGFGIKGGSDQLFYYWRGAIGDRMDTPVIDDLYGTEHYATLSYDAAAKTMTIYMDGVELAQKTGVTLVSTSHTPSRAYVGVHLPPIAGNHPEGVAQFYGTIYNLNMKLEPTTLDQHIEEAAKHVTTFTPEANLLVGSYNLDEASGGVLKPAAGTGTPAKLHGIGDAGIQLDGSQWVEFDLGADAPPEGKATYEITYVQPQDNPLGKGAMLLHHGKHTIANSTRYMTANHGGGNSPGYFGQDSVGGIFGETIPTGTKTRVTGVYKDNHYYYYIDGMLVKDGVASNATSVASGIFRLGAYGDNRFPDESFTGTMYDAKVWNKALTAEQVAGLAGYTYSDLVAHFDFAGSNPLSDKSGHGHDGTMGSTAPATTGLYPRFDGSTTGFEYAELTYSDGSTNVSIDTIFTLEPQADPHNIIQAGKQAVADAKIPIWLRASGDGSDIHIGINDTIVNTFPLNTGLTVHSFKGTVNSDRYNIMVDNVNYTGVTPAAAKKLPLSDYRLYIGNGVTAGANMKGTLYKLNVTLNSATREFGRNGRTYNGAWSESRNASHFMPDANVTWVPAPANIKGEYPEFLGTNNDGIYTGAVANNSVLNAGTGTNKIRIKTSFDLKKATDNPNLFSLEMPSLGPLRLEAIGGNTTQFTLWLPLSGATDNRLAVGIFNNGYNNLAPCVLDCTVDYTKKTASGTVNGIPFSQSLTELSNTGYVNSSTLYLGCRARDINDVNGVIYGLELWENDVVKLRYDGTRSWDSTRLIDVSGGGNDATIVGSINWVTGTPPNGGAIVTVPNGEGFDWVQDDLAKNGDTIIDVSNSTVQGKVYLHVWVRDALGNERQVTYGPFDYDTTRPEVSVSARKPKSSETATSGYVSMSVSDNWLLKNDPTRWAKEATTGRLENPESLFTSSAWQSFGLGNTANRGSATDELAGVGTGTKYYVAVEAEDWLGNRTVQYLYVDSSTLFDDRQAPTIKFTNVGKNDTYSKRQMVQVDVDDNPENGKTASGVNDQTLEYAWSTSQTAPADGWASFNNHNTLRLEKGDGTWYLHVRAADNAGNNTSGKSDAQKLDNTKPTIKPTRANDSWSKDGFTVNAGVADLFAPTLAGIDKIYWASGSRTVDYFAGGAVAGSGITEVSGGSFTASDSGEYTIYAVDKAGNENVGYYTESKLDKTAPTVRLSPENMDWTKENITVTVTPADAGGSGVASVSYTLNGTSGTLDKTGGTVTVSTQGENTLTVTVTDGAGNTGSATGVYKIDKEKNTIALTANASTLKTHSVAVTVGATASGAASSVKYGWGQGDAPEYWSAAELTNGSFTATRSIGDDTWKLFVESISATGVKNTANDSYSFDNTAPHLTLALGTEDWTQSTTLAASSEDGAELTATLDGTPLSRAIRARDVNITYPVNKNGTYEVTATDGAGNATTQSIKVTTIDTAAPIASLTPTGGEKWFSGSVNVTAAASDVLSGVNTITYTVDETPNLPKAELTTDGEHTVTATVTDRAGNSFTTGQETYKLDSAPPTLNPKAEVTVDTLTFAATAADNVGGSGINNPATTATLEQDRNNHPVSSTFKDLHSNNYYTVNVTAADNAGNTATGQTSAYTLAAVPTALADVKVLSTGLTATLVPGANTVAPAYGIKVYKENEQGTPLYTTPVGEEARGTAVSATFSGVGRDDVLFMEVTAYNEDGKPNSKTFKITGSGGVEVNEPPTIAVTAPSAETLLGAQGKLTLSGTAADVNKGMVTVTATVSGVTKGTMVKDGFWTLEWQATELLEGEYTITVTAADDKGEQGTDIAPKITVDKTPPKPPKVAVDAGWVADAEFTPSPADGDTDVVGYKYRVGNGAWLDYSEGAAVQGASGEHILEVCAVDKAGNIGQATQKTVRIENDRPTVTCTLPIGGRISANTTAPLGFEDEYKLTDAGWLFSKDANLTAADVTKGMTKAVIADGKTASASAELGNEDGSWYIYALAKDNAGETLKTFGPYVVDKTPPAVPAVTAADITKDSATLSGADKITDASGVDTAKTFYHYTNGTEQTSANGMLSGLVPNALYSAWLTAADNAGNTARGENTRFCTLAADPVNVKLSGRGKDFLTFAITGDAKNITPPEYRIVLLNGANKQVAESIWSTSTLVRLPVPATAWPVHGTIQTRNREKTENPPIELNGDNFSELDPTIPDGEITGSSAPIIKLTPSTVTNVLHDGDSITLSGTASDADGDELYITAGINDVEKTVKLAAATGDRSWTLTWDIAADRLCAGTYGSYGNVTVTAMDPDDNRADATDPNTYRIDNAGPQAPTAVGGLPQTVQGINGKYTVNLTAGVDRGAAGVAEWSYTLDGTTTTGTGDAITAIAVNGDGAHTLTAVYTDKLGNAGEEENFSFTVDSAAPILTTKLYTFAPDTTDGWKETTKQPGASVWYNAVLRGRYTADDGTVTYAVTPTADLPADYDQAAQGLTAEVTMEEGTHWVHLRAEDAAGNVTVKSFGPYRVDLTPLPVTVTVDGTSAATKHTATPKVDAQGDASGLAAAQYLWSDAPVYSDTMTGWKSFAPAGETLTLNGKNGTWYLYARADDAAGNRTVERSEGVRMDNTPPELTIEKSEEESTKREEIVLATATDEHSDVAAQSYQAGKHTAADFAEKETNFGQGSIPLGENGIYTFFAKDQAGNTTLKEYTVTELDMGIPVITAAGPVNVWNKDPFTVTVTITDPDGKLDRVGIIDPKGYGLPADDPNSTVGYMGLTDINNVISPLSEGIDPAHFTIVRPAADMLTNGKLTVSVGSGSGPWYYNADGGIMLHFAARDESGNITYASFGPYRLDNTPPRVTTDIPNTILATLVDPSETGQHNFTGYAISDNLTAQFVPEDATDIVPGPEDGSYLLAFDPAKMDNFTVAKTYPGAVTVTVTDLAGNRTKRVLDCKVCDNVPPVYGSGEKDEITGLMKDNYIEIAIDPKSDYFFKEADFTPTEGDNKLNEQSLPFGKITLHTLPDKGKLLLGGRELTAADLPMDVLWSDIVKRNLVYRANAGWHGPDSTMGFLATDGAGNRSGDTYNRTMVHIKADSTSNPEYLEGLEKLKAMHIVTNVAPTLKHVSAELPKGWSFTGEDMDKRLKASADNEGKQSFGVLFTPGDPQYSEMRIKQDFPVSTVALDVHGGLDMRVINKIGDTLTLSPVKLIVTGAKLPDAGKYSTANMGWQSSCKQITAVVGDPISDKELSATVTALDKGVSLIGVAYNGSTSMLGYVLIKVVEERSDSANEVKDITDITETLENLVDTENPSDTEKKAVNAVADEVTKLPPDKKESLVKDDVGPLDELKKAVNKGSLNISIDDKPKEGEPLAPQKVEAVGTSIACGVDEGEVTYYLTPVTPTAKDTKLEIKLEMQVEGKKEQLKAPLFFTVELPAELDTGDLAIWHITDGSPKPIAVPFTHDGQQVSFKLTSFSSLRFNLASTGEPTTPPVDGDSDDDDDDDSGTSSAPTVPEKPQPPVQPEKPGNGTGDGTPGDGDGGGSGGTSEGDGKPTDKPDDGGKETPEDEIRDELEDVINKLPDDLTDEQRQEYIDKLTEIADEAIAALEGTNDPAEAERIAAQAQQEMEKLLAEALALVGAGAKPFVVLSALFALTAVLLAVFALLKRSDKRRKLFTAIFAALAVAVFLLTTGWSGFALANGWTLAVAAFTVCAAMGVFVGYSKEEDEDAVEAKTK